MRAGGTKNLVIDVRANGGGNDEMWIEGILPYFANKRYRWASHYRKRVVVADAAKHEAVGDIVDGEVETWTPPQPDNPLRYSGKVYVLVGPATYSSAVVFSNVVQDFGFGVVAGMGGSVRTATTGGTRRTTLPNSGLILVSPRFVLTRPSGATSPRAAHAGPRSQGSPAVARGDRNALTTPLASRSQSMVFIRLMAGGGLSDSNRRRQFMDELSGRARAAIITALLLFTFHTRTASAQAFAKGADVSWITQMEAMRHIAGTTTPARSKICCRSSRITA